jgi:hypothetical protein
MFIVGLAFHYIAVLALCASHGKEEATRVKVQTRLSSFLRPFSLL